MTLAQFSDNDTIPTAWYNEVRDRIQEGAVAVKFGNVTLVGTVTQTGGGLVSLSGDIEVDGNLKWKSGTSSFGVLDHAASASRTWTFPDITGTVMLLEGAQTAAGAKTFSAAVSFGDTITVTGAATLNGPTTVAQNLVLTANLHLKSGTSFVGEFDHAITAGRVWTFPDVTGTVVLLEGNQTLTGAKTFTQAILTDQNLQTKSGTSFTGTFDHAITADRTWTFPDFAGTIALLERTQTFTVSQTFAGATFTQAPSIQMAGPALVLTDTGGGSNNWQIRINAGALQFFNSTDNLVHAQVGEEGDWKVGESNQLVFDVSSSRLGIGLAAASILDNIHIKASEPGIRFEHTSAVDNWFIRNMSGNLHFVNITEGVTTVIQLRDKSVLLGDTAGMAANATDGHVYIPGINGTPTGLPHLEDANKTAVLFDYANGIFYLHNGNTNTWTAAGSSLPMDSGLASFDYDPASQTYNAGTTTVLRTWDAGTGAQILLFATSLPDPIDAGLRTEFKVEYHDGTSTIYDNVTGGGGVGQITGFYECQAELTGLLSQSPSNNGKTIRKFIFQVVNTTGGNITRDIGSAKLRAVVTPRGTGGSLTET